MNDQGKPNDEHHIPNHIDAVKVASEITKPISGRNDQDGDSKRRDWKETKKPWRLRRKPLTHADWIQIFLLVAAIAYGWLTYQLWDAAKTAQRAYLLIENVRLHGKLDICNDRPKFGEMNVTLEPGTSMWLQWDIKNAGLTPALNIRQRFKFYVGDKAPLEGEGEPIGGTRVALGPGECDPSPDAPWVWLDRSSTRHWTKADADAISPKGGKHLWAVISVDYKTAAGAKGFSSFCGYYDNSLFTSCDNIVR